jgi:hypothetical protein
MRIRAGLTGVLCVLTLSVSACGSGSGTPAGTSRRTATTTTPSPSATPTASAAGPLDVCALLTPADLQQAFGSPFGAGEGNHQAQTGADQCVWTNTDVPPVRTFSVTVLRQGSIAGALKDSGMGVKELHASARAALGDVKAVDLGDDAYLSGSTLAVLDGDTEYTFSTAFGDTARAVRGMEALAAKIVG